jgi:hypothetical protein
VILDHCLTDGRLLCDPMENAGWIALEQISPGALHGLQTPSNRISGCVPDIIAARLPLLAFAGLHTKLYSCHICELPEAMKRKNNRKRQSDNDRATVACKNLRPAIAPPQIL